MKNIAIIGLGWLGKPLATELLRSGYTINGATRSLERLKALAGQPFYVSRIVLEADKISGDWDAFIDDVDVLVISIPPGKDKALYAAKMKQVCEHLPAKCSVVFVSSTSVYGNDNATVTEETKPRPEYRSGPNVWEAEQVLSEQLGSRLAIVRMAGLIGLKRHPGRFLAGKKELKSPDVPVNLIHQTDAVEIIKRVIENNAFGEVFNACADIHPKRKEFYTKAAEALKLPEPEFLNETKAWKIVDNTKSKSVLGMEYRFSDPSMIFHSDRMPKISIIGAGPGATDLLTIKAVEALKEAEILLHDNLVSEQILSLAADAERIYVGRKYGDASNQDDRQQRINELMEEHYRQGKKVVRIKSGDPYIFGRAAEEARYLMDRDLPFEVVPGISASLAAANRFNFPVTERRKSSSLLICTAHTADYSFDQLKGIAELLKDGNSLAIYMGLKSLNKLIPKLIEVTGDSSIPISAVSNVSRPEEVLLSSDLKNIRDEIEKNPLEMPVVFIAGVEPIKER